MNLTNPANQNSRPARLLLVLDAESEIPKTINYAVQKNMIGVGSPMPTLDLESGAHRYEAIASRNTAPVDC